MVEDKHRGYEDHLRDSKVKGYEGPVSCETPNIPPDAAQQTPEQYISSRFGAIPQEARAAMGLHDNPEMYMHIELMFRSCYWRERHNLLEKNIQVTIKQVLAARAAVYAMAEETMLGAPQKEIKQYADDRIEEQMMEMKDKTFDQMPKL